LHLRVCQEDILITVGPGRNSVLTEASGHGEVLVNNKTGRKGNRELRGCDIKLATSSAYFVV